MLHKAAFDAPEVSVVPTQGPTLSGELKDVLAGRTEEEEAMCAVCSGGLSLAPNLIVFCERCDIAVHQKCYGVDEIPAGVSARLTRSILPWQGCFVIFAWTSCPQTVLLFALFCARLVALLPDSVLLNYGL